MKKLAITAGIAILIITTTFGQESKVEIKSARKAGKIHIDVKSDPGEPIIFIDDKLSSKEVLDKISPDNIISVSVLKDEKSLDKYNTEVGVILVKTKGKKE